MNPHAKEFVPAHLLKRRQDEEEETDELTEKVGQVGLDDSNSKLDGDAETSRGEGGDGAGGDSTENDSPAVDDTAPKSKENSDTDQSSKPQHNHSNNVNNTSNHSNKAQHNKTNGEKQSSGNEDDRHLLKAGETYCEFNGEQFIIPGEDDEYEPDQNHEYGRKAGYDFGNAEDNEDEDVCNAYEQFLDNLPE